MPVDEIRDLDHRPDAFGPSVSDRMLLDELRKGNDRAAEELYFRYVKRLSALARKKTGADLRKRFDEDDVVQSVFRILFDKARTGHYDIPENGDLWPLLAAMAVQKVRATCSHHRAQCRTPDREQVDWGSQCEQEIERVESKSEDLFLQMILGEVIERLPLGHRQVVRCRLEGRDVEEIASILGRSKRTIERMIQETKQIIGQQLNEHDS